MNASIPVIVLGGTGYVAGEMLRLVAMHPDLELAAAVSTSQAGAPIGSAFAHLAGAYRDVPFKSLGDAETMLSQSSESARWAVLSAAPHGASAGIVERLIAVADAAGVALSVVDASADFRFRSADAFEAVYGHAHPTPALLADFTCAVPEHLDTIATAHAAHPGCFATSMLLGIVPLLKSGLAESEVFVSAVTGSTGAGGTPRETTHHPVRQSNLFAYQALRHRHSPEVAALTEAATGHSLQLHFVPHSGPFARGIHATVFAPKKSGVTIDDVRTSLFEFYAGCDLVQVTEPLPRLKDVAGGNYAMLGATVDDDSIVVCCVIDNLLKGAASGAIQWLNRLLGLPDARGLTFPSAGWI